MPRPRAYSPSRLKRYQGCPRRYYYEYVIKLPTRQRAEQSTGISLHGALEAVARAGGLEATGVEGAIALLAASWRSEGFASPEAEALARAKAEAELRRYLEALAPSAGRTVLAEAALAGEFEGIPFYGIVDRVDAAPDGTLELIDYKSGRQTGLSESVRQQLAIYRFLVSEKLGAAPERVTIHHLSQNVALPVEMPEAVWDATLRQAAAIARRLAEDEVFDPVVGAGCRHCDFKHRCLAFKRAGR